MANFKREHSTDDAAPVVIYGLKSAANPNAVPIYASTFGTLVISTGLSVPAHDTQVINEADPNNVVITYKLNGATVGTKTIVVSGTTTTITVS